MVKNLNTFYDFFVTCFMVIGLLLTSFQTVFFSVGFFSFFLYQYEYIFIEFDIYLKSRILMFSTTTTIFSLLSATFALHWLFGNWDYDTSCEDISILKYNTFLRFKVGCTCCDEWTWSLSIRGMHVF